MSRRTDGDSREERADGVAPNDGEAERGGPEEDAHDGERHELVRARASEPVEEEWEKHGAGGEGERREEHELDGALDERGRPARVPEDGEEAEHAHRDEVLRERRGARGAGVLARAHVAVRERLRQDARARGAKRSAQDRALERRPAEERRETKPGDGAHAHLEEAGRERGAPPALQAPRVEVQSQREHAEDDGELADALDDVRVGEGMRALPEQHAGREIAQHLGHAQAPAHPASKEGAQSDAEEVEKEHGDDDRALCTPLKRVTKAFSGEDTSPHRGPGRRVRRAPPAASSAE